MYEVSWYFAEICLMLEASAFPENLELYLRVLSFTTTQLQGIEVGMLLGK
jgi:hypothetical protein